MKGNVCPDGYTLAAHEEGQSLEDQDPTLPICGCDWKPDPRGWFRARLGYIPNRLYGLRLRPSPRIYFGQWVFHFRRLPRVE